jgi:hypothetical protein
MKTPYFEQSTTVTVANGASLSGAASLKELKVLAFVTDAAWDTNAVTFQGSFDGTNFFNLWNDSAEYSIAAVPASTLVAINPVNFMGLHSVKVRSGTSAAAVNQVGATVVTLIVSPM